MVEHKEQLDRFWGRGDL